MTIFLFCATGAWPQQWDTLVNMIPKYAEGLVAHHIIRPEAASRLPLYDWPRWRNADEDTVDTHDNERIGVLSMLAAASRAREEYLCYRAANDSLQRVAPLKLSVRPKEKDMEQTGERWWAIKNARCGNSPVEREAWQFNMDWLQVAPADYAEFKQIEENSSTIDLHLDSIPLSELIDDLREIGLLDFALANKLTSGIKRGHIRYPEDLFEEASNLGRLPEIRHQRAEQQGQCLELVKAGKMTEERALAVGQYADEFEIHDLSDVASALTLSCVVDSSGEWSADEIEICQAVVNGVERLLPDLRIEGWAISTDSLAPEGILIRRGDLRFSVRQREYSNVFPTYVSEGGSKAYYARQAVDALLNCINKAICDQGIEYRISTLEKYAQDTTDEESWVPKGRVLFVEDRIVHEIFHTDNHGGTLAPPWPSGQGFCESDIERAVTDFRSAHLLDHLSSEQIDSASALVNANLKETWGEVLSCFPHVVDIPMWIRWSETSNHPYTDQLVELSRISHGAFKPLRIRERWVPRRGLYRAKTFSFTMGGKQYHVGEFDELNMDVINQALDCEHVPGRFCSVNWRDHRAYIFLTREQYDALHDKYLSDYLDPWNLHPSRWKSAKGFGTYLDVDR